MAPRKNTKSDSTPAPVASEVAKVNTSRKNTKSASNPAPVAASKVAKVPAGRKNTKSATTPAPVAASKTAKVPAGRKKTKSATTPAPVDDSKTTTVYAGRKTRAMIAAEEKVAEEKAAEEKAAEAEEQAAEEKATEEKATEENAATQTGNAALKADVAATDMSNIVKPAATKAKTIKTVKPAVTEAKTVESTKTTQPVKGTTLKSASSALKALRAASKTHQAATEDATAEVATSTLEQPAAIMKPVTVTPTVAEPIITETHQAATEASTAEVATSTLKQPAAIMKPATVTPAVADPIITKSPRKTMSVAQAAELMKVFRWSKPSAEMPNGEALVAPVFEEPALMDSALAVPPVEDVIEITPVRTVHRPQAEDDKDLEAWIKAEQKKGPLWGTQLDAVGPEAMARDFQRMGFRGMKRQELLAMKEPILVDGLTQRVSATTVVGAVPGTGPGKPKPAKRAPKHRDLVIFEDKGTSISLPPYTFAQLQLLTYITRMGSIRSSQGVPYQETRRAASLHNPMGDFRPWQRSRSSEEHEVGVRHIARHASEPPPLHRRLHNVRPQGRRLEAHPEPPQGGRARPACALNSSSPRSWRQAQRNPCRRTTTRSHRPGGQKT
jgi:hypothetical protein